MLIFLDKTYMTNALFPNTNWTGEISYIIDETTPHGLSMMELYTTNYPFIDFEHDGELVTNVIVLPKPERPPEIEGKGITLVKHEDGAWEYIYSDIPLSEIEVLQQKLAEQQVLIDTMLGVSE